MAVLLEYVDLLVGVGCVHMPIALGYITVYDCMLMQTYIGV